MPSRLPGIPHSQVCNGRTVSQAGEGSPEQHTLGLMSLSFAYPAPVAGSRSPVGDPALLSAAGHTLGCPRLGQSPSPATHINSKPCQDHAVGKAFGWGDTIVWIFPSCFPKPYLGQSSPLPDTHHLAKRIIKSEITFKEIKGLKIAAGRPTLGISECQWSITSALQNWVFQPTPAHVERQKHLKAAIQRRELPKSPSISSLTSGKWHLQPQHASLVTHNSLCGLTHSRTEFLHPNQTFHYIFFIYLFLFCLKELVTL